MKLYSDFPLKRLSQILTDLLALGIIAFGVWLGAFVSSTMSRLADLGRQLELAGGGFKGAMTQAGESLGTVPLVGESIRAPFDQASATGEMLEEAGQTTQSFILTTGTVTGILVTAMIVVVVCSVWLRRRIRFARRASEAAKLQRMEGGIDVLALRALTTGSRNHLAAIGAHPAHSWRTGDFAVITRLAELELREAGVRLAR